MMTLQNDDIAASYSRVAKQCMIEAANELHPDPEDKNLLINIGVSCDGTWQKGGFSSLLGTTTVISIDTGKCLDCSVLSKNVQSVHTGKVVKTQRSMRHS